MDVKVTDLKRYFGRVRAVDGISFRFNAGHVFGFVGPNGAGKTTTMRVMATIDEPTAGDVWVDGISLVEDPEKARRLVGYMPDSLPTHRDMTVRDYLDFFARAYGLRGKRRITMLDRIEDFTSLAPLRDKLLRALSKGMKQRVSLARAIVHDPSVLVLDEPAAGLDPRARIELRELLRALADQGKAILISSHILTELADICNGAIIIEKGRILRAGTIDELVHKDVAHRTVLLRALDGDVNTLCQQVLEIPNISAVRRAGSMVEVDVLGEESNCADLLETLVQRGVRVVEFHQRQADLEDVFMAVTKGEVQ